MIDHLFGREARGVCPAMVCLIGVGKYSEASESSLLVLELLILTCDCKHNMTRIPGTAVEMFDNLFLLASVFCSINRIVSLSNHSGFYKFTRIPDVCLA